MENFKGVIFIALIYAGNRMLKTSSLNNEVWKNQMSPSLYLNTFVITKNVIFC